LAAAPIYHGPEQGGSPQPLCASCAGGVAIPASRDPVTCAGCGGALGETDAEAALVVGGAPYHAACVRCHVCGVQLGGGSGESSAYPVASTDTAEDGRQRLACRSHR
jgi:hypothetical protein